MSKKILRKEILIAILFLFLGAALAYWYTNSRLFKKSKLENKVTTAKQNIEGCESKQNLGDLTVDGKPEYILFCGNIININYPPTDNIFTQKVEDISSFYDLFHYVGNIWNEKSYENYWTTKEAQVFPKNKPQFFAITSLYYSGGSSLTAFGVYHIEEKNIKRVFQSKFIDMKGRDTSVVFSENKPSFTTTALSLDEGKTTITNYVWDQEKDSFEKGETKILLLNGIPVDQAEAECTKNNGIWTKGNFNEGFFCNNTFSDGGKKCEDSSDCLSQQCISFGTQNNSLSIVGECSDRATVYGCHGLVKKGRLTNFACID